MASVTKNRTKPKSQSARADIKFPVGRIHRLLKTRYFSQRISSKSAVYLAAVLEFLTTFIIELSGNFARDYRKKRINPRHICLAVFDEELTQLLKKVFIPSGGTIPWTNKFMERYLKRHVCRKEKKTKWIKIYDSRDPDSSGFLWTDSAHKNPLSNVESSLDLILFSHFWVSKKWNQLLSEKTFWVQKSIYDFGEYILPPKELRHLPFDYKKICLKRPFNKNLIRDNKHISTRIFHPRNQTGPPGFGFDPKWKWTKSLGFSLESPPVFMTGYRDDDFDELQFQQCLATSHFWSEKEIIIDLWNEGLDPNILDTYRPSITVSEYVSHRADCASAYSLEVWLLSTDPREWHFYTHRINPTFEKQITFQQWENQKWIKVEQEFIDYGPGLRYIAMRSRGKDLQFWKGNYGVKMAKPEIIVNYKFSNTIT